MKFPAFNIYRCRMHEKIDAFVSAIYDTGLNGWDDFLFFIAHELDSVGATYFVFDKEQMHVKFWSNFGHDVTTERTYSDHYMSIDPTLDLAIRSPVGAVLHLSDHFSTRYIERSEYFQDFLLPSRLGNVVGAKIMEQDGLVGILSIQEERNIKGMSEPRRDFLKQIFPHLVRAARIHWRMRSLELQRNGIEAAIARLPQTMIVVNADMKIQYMNAAAESLVSSACAIKVCGRALRCVDARRDAELKAAVAGATVGTRLESRYVAIANDNKQIFLSVLPIAFSLAAPIGDDHRALIIAAGPMPAEKTFFSSVGDRFALTKAEKVLAYRLFAGGTLAEIASALGLSRETVRCQLHAIFLKTGTNRQGQLLSLMHQASACLPGESPPSS